jgi:hypothetical protein
MRVPGQSLLARASALVRSPRAVAASLAGNSLAWQALPDLLASGLGRLADAAWGALPFGLTAVVVATEDAATVGLVFEWVLFGYLVYRLLPRLFPDEEPGASVLDERWFKLLTAALVLALAQPIAASLPVLAVDSLRLVRIDSGSAFVAVFGTWGVVSWTLLYASLRRR